MFTNVYKCLPENIKKFMSRLCKCRKNNANPGIISLEKNRNLGSPAWSLSTNSHTQLLTCLI